MRDGTVLAAVTVEVLETSSPNGPARLVRVIDHPGMRAAAGAVMAAIGTTGLVGMDFLLDADGAAHLIELNARVTPTCRLALGPGQDPTRALRASFPGTTAPAAPCDAIGRIIDLSVQA